MRYRVRRNLLQYCDACSQEVAITENGNKRFFVFQLIWKNVAKRDELITDDLAIKTITTE